MVKFFGSVGMMIIVILVVIAVLDKDGSRVPGASYVGLKSDFVEPGLWLKPTPIPRPEPVPRRAEGSNVQRPTTDGKETRSSSKAVSQPSPRKAPKNRLASSEGINIPY